MVQSMFNLLSKMQRWVLIPVLSFFLVVLVATAGGKREGGAVPHQGYLVKTGSSYLLITTLGNGSREDYTFQTAEEALQFAKKYLRLEISMNPKQNAEVTELWTREASDRRMVFWRTTYSNDVNRMTFRNEAESRIFERAFKTGSYSTSPSGHAIYLSSKNSIRPILAFALGR